MSARSDAVLCECQGRVAVITFNRPLARNQWTTELGESYLRHLAAVEGDPRVRAVVVTGSGHTFCAGADLEALRSRDQRDTIDDRRALARAFAHQVSKPIVAAINGACIGAGLVCALYCDVRFAATTAKIGTAFARRGLPAEYGLATLLPRIVGVGRASDLLLSGRILTGREAHAFGLVEHVSTPESVLDDAIAYAAELSALCSPWAMATIKRQLHEGAEEELRGSLSRAVEAQREAYGRPDLAEGVESFVQRRPPAFPDL